MITVKIHIQIPYVSGQLSINSIYKIIKNKKGKYTIGKTSGATKMQEMITTMTTGATNDLGKPWDPKRTVHLNMVGYRPNTDCDFHNCLKQIADGVQKGLEKYGITDDSDFWVHSMEPRYDPCHKDHATIHIYVWQEDDKNKT